MTRPKEPLRFFESDGTSVTPTSVIVPDAAITGTVVDLSTGGGGSQTPWTSAIDGAGYALTGAGVVAGTAAVGGFATTATAAGTTTLLVTSKQVQEFTGVTTQTVVLPAVSTLPQIGFWFRIVNNSTGVVTVQSSGANTIQALAAGTSCIFTANALTGTGASVWTAGYYPRFDTNGNLVANNVSGGFATTATAAGTTTLTVASAQTQEFTGVTTQTVVLPVITTLPQAGYWYRLVNKSTGTVTVNSSGSNLVQTLTTGMSCYVSATKVTADTTAAGWDVQAVPNMDTAGNLNIANALALSIGSATVLTADSGGGSMTLGNNSSRVDLITAANMYGRVSSGFQTNLNATDYRLAANILLNWSSGSADATAAADTGLARVSAGLIKATNGSTGITGYIGGGPAIASATALPLPVGNVFHVTGTTNITSITATNLASGVNITLIFDGVLTFTDGNNLKLAGNFVTTADDTITLVYDGTNFYEVCRSVN